MLYIKREHGDVVYKMGKTNAIPNDPPAPSPTPKLTQREHLTYDAWYSENEHHVEKITAKIVDTLSCLQSDKYIVKITDLEGMQDSIKKWIYQCSNNKLKHF